MFTINDKLAGKPAFPDFPTLQQRWDAMMQRHAGQIAELQVHPEYVRLSALGNAALVNTAVNHLVKYTPDAWMDNWSTPLETLKACAGDCEDYAILKTYLIKGAKLVVMHGLDVMHVDHAVCQYGNLYLDNRVDWLLNRVDLNGYAFMFEGVF